MSESIVYFNGEFRPESEAVVSIRSHAFLYGTSVFEGIRAYWNAEDERLYIFRGPEHYRRLENSTKIMRMELEHSVDELMDLTIELIKKNDFSEDIYIRPTVYKSDHVIGPSLLNSKDSFSMFVMPLGDYLDTSKAIKVCTSNWRRLDDAAIPARAKVSGSYVNTALAKSEAQLNGFDEAIMLDDRGHVCEGSAMNLFIIREGKLITSAVNSNILEGITRATVAQIAKEELGLDTLERDIDRTELFVADEAFFCGTGAQISPIGSIDHYSIGSGEMGPVTTKLQELYFEIVKNKNKKYSNWCQVV